MNDYVPVTYFPAATQRVFADNQQRLRNRPYAGFFSGRMYLHAGVLDALNAPMPPGQAVPPGDPRRALDRDVGDPTGYCVLPDGTAYAASRTPFPGATADMLAWWFWWFMVERERYALWHPYNHVRADARDSASLTVPGLTHEQR